MRYSELWTSRPLRNLDVYIRKEFFFFFFFLGCATCRILVHQPGVKPVSPALEAWSLSHWATWEVPIRTLTSSFRTSFHLSIHQIRSDQSLSRVRLFATPWIAALRASLSITNSRSSLRLTSIESVMPSSHLILCHPLLLLPSILPRIGVFSNESVLLSGGQNVRVSASTSVLPMTIQYWFPLRWTDWISLHSKGLSRVFSNTTVQKHQFFGTQLSLYSNSHIHTWQLEKP